MSIQNVTKELFLTKIEEWKKGGNFVLPQEDVEALEAYAVSNGLKEFFQKAKDSAASKTVQLKKKASIKTVKDYIATLPNVPPAVLDAVKYLEGGGGGFKAADAAVAAVTVGTKGILDKLFPPDKRKAGDTVTMVQGCELTGYGPGNIMAQAKKWVEKDIYVSFDPKTKLYKLEGLGAEPPNWKGPKKKGLPAEQQAGLAPAAANAAGVTTGVKPVTPPVTPPPPPVGVVR